MSTRPNGSPRQTIGAALTSDGAGVLTGGSAAQEVFLSPRVIDRRAYSELASELRDMIDRASAERAALTAALDQAGKAARDLRERELAQQGNFDLSVRAMKSMDEKTSRVEQLIARAADQTKAFEKLESQAGSIVEAKLSMLDARVLAITSAATSKTEALEERVRQASRELEQRIDAIRRDAQSIAAPVHDGLARLCDRATTLINSSAGSGGLNDLVARAESVREAADSIVKRLEETRERAERDRSTIDAWNEGAEKKYAAIAARQQELEAGASDLIGRAERNFEIIKSTLSSQQIEATERSQRSIDSLRTMVETLETQAQRASAEGERVLSEIRPQTDAAILELRRAIEQARDATNASGLAMKLLDKSNAQIKDLLDRLEPWRGVLDGDAGGLPEPLERMIHGVRSELGTIAGALRNAAERAEAAANLPVSWAPIVPQAIGEAGHSPVARVTRRAEPMTGAD